MEELIGYYIAQMCRGKVFKRYFKGIKRISPEQFDARNFYQYLQLPGTYVFTPQYHTLGERPRFGKCVLKVVVDENGKRTFPTV